MPAVQPSLEQQKDYNVGTVTAALGGARVEDHAQVGWNGEKGHEWTYTPDNNLIIVASTPEITGSVAVHDTSPMVDAAISAWENDETMSISYTPPNDAGHSAKTFRYCRITSVDQGSWEINGMPTVTFEWQGGDTS